MPGQFVNDTRPVAVVYARRKSYDNTPCKGGPSRAVIPRRFSGTNTLGFPLLGKELVVLQKMLATLQPTRIIAKVFPSENSAANQLVPSLRWFNSLQAECGTDLKRVVIGHSLGGDTIRESGSVDADDAKR